MDQEIIERAGLTPTDLLHITGEFSPWDAEIAQFVTRFAAKIWNEDAKAFTLRVKDWITRKINAEIIQYLSHRSLSDPVHSSRQKNLDRWFCEENLEGQDPYLGCKISLKVPLVGIGAPASIFLPSVARSLGAEFILPAHYGVANAVGTVVGNVMVREEASIFPCTEGAVITGSFVRMANHQQHFDTYQQALAFAREALAKEVLERAKAAGADMVEVETQETEYVPGMANLFSWAVGRPEMKS